MRSITDQVILWSGKFPVRFSALNAAVKWHLRMPLDDVQTATIEETAGLIGYSIKLSGVGDLGDLWIRELPNERFTALIITAPKLEINPWTAEEQALIASQPNREEKLRVTHDLASTVEAQREEVLKYQDIVLNSLLKQLLSDSEITDALSSSLGHRSLMLNLGQIFNGYERISKTDVEAEDIEKLNNLDDAEVRALLAKVILGVDAVVLQREAVKPHGSFEIADMELPITVQGESFYLCIPVKSAREIRSNTVPESWAYQILRPFFHLHRCAVVVISAKRCSESLMNYIKRTKDQLGWAIEVIEAEELAKLLKINSLI
jgi:hypothetical protein